MSWHLPYNVTLDFLGKVGPDISLWIFFSGGVDIVVDIGVDFLSGDVDIGVDISVDISVDFSVDSLKEGF